jgi:Radical SAM superfamily
MPSVRRDVFQFVMIKPSHYDNDGYPIQWIRSIIPSNTLAAVNGLVLDCQRREVLGPDVEIRPLTLDETNTRIRPEKIIHQINKIGGKVLIGFVGVQSNQFPRAVDLARPFLEAGFQVAMGGFHLAGCIAMLPELPDEIRAAQEMGISIFAGEAEEHRLDEIFRDAYQGTLKPIYNHMDDLPSLNGQPVPFLFSDTVGRTIDKVSSFDMGRGCPFQCSFCTIINVQGRKSRFRSADDLEKIVRDNIEQGVYKFFITDDNFARNRDWEAMLDRLILLREREGIKLKLIIQVDTLCHKTPNFIEKACRAGVKRVFIGLENINPDNLMAAKKRQNKITEYRLMLQQWREHGATTYAGYILGFPNDTKESILHDIEIIKKELPLDMLEFFFLTPLPGSEDHKVLLAKGGWMDPDLNKYDLHHRVTHHPRMSDEEWDDAYHQAWLSYYNPQHLKTILLRCGAIYPSKLRVRVKFLLTFFLPYTVDHLHPLEGGLFRLKYRRDRRPGMKIESPMIFYPKYVVETAVKWIKIARATLHAEWILWQVRRSLRTSTYNDIAITPQIDEDLDTLALFRDTTGGMKAVDHKHRTEKLLDKVRAKAAG